MATPVYQSSTSLVLPNGGATSGTLNYPAGTQSGDLLLVVASRSNTALGTFTVPGFTQTGTDQAGVSPSFNAWYRVADGTEGASITVSHSSATSVKTIWMHRFTGADTTTPIEAAPTASVTGSSATPSMPSVTTGNANCLALCIELTNTAGFLTNGTDPSGETGGSWITRLNDKPSGGQAHALFSANLASATTISGGTVTLGSSSAWRTGGMAIRGTPAAQSLTPSLFTNTQTFYAPTITQTAPAIRGGDDAPLLPHEIKRLQRRLRAVRNTEGERRRAELARIRDTLERAFDGRPLEDLPPEVREHLPQASAGGATQSVALAIDWRPLLMDLDALQTMLARLEAEAADEEDAAIALLLA